jgi:hypothetical protein
MSNNGDGIETVCRHLAEAIALLDRAGEDMEAANLSLSLERLTSKYDVSWLRGPQDASE